MTVFEQHNREKATTSGAYLAGIPVTIFDHSGKQVLKTIADGPWCYVRLPEGRYTIKATHDGQEKEKTIRVDRGLGLVMFHWGM